MSKRVSSGGESGLTRWRPTHVHWTATTAAQVASSDPAHDNDESDIARKCDTVPAYILSICSFRAPSFIERMTLRYQLNESPNPAHTGPGIYVFLFVYPWESWSHDDQQSFSFSLYNFIGLFLNIFNIYVIWCGYKPMECRGGGERTPRARDRSVVIRGVT